MGNHKAKVEDDGKGVEKGGCGMNTEEIAECFLKAVAVTLSIISIVFIADLIIWAIMK